MAGISFELKRTLKDKRITSILLAFSYSTALSAGQWIISIISIFVSGIIAYHLVPDKMVVRQYQVCITYITAISLILTGPFQLLFTRYIADRIFEKEYFRVLPNFTGVLILNSGIGFLVALILSTLTLNKEGNFFIVLFSFTFSLVCGLWMANVMLSSLKSYKYIFLSFLIGFGTVVALTPLFSRFGLDGLMFSFFTGVSIIFLMLFGYIFYTYPSEKLIEFDFLNRKKVYLSLALSGFLYNLGIWADKFVFWFYPSTSEAVIGPFRGSIVYDIPIFLAYLVIAPGMGAFFLKLEGEFADYYDRYYRAVREGETLRRIYEIGYEMVQSVRSLILDVFRIQAIAIIIAFLLEKTIFKLFSLSPLYIPLFNVMTIGTFLQLLFMVIVSVLFYFDLRIYALYSIAFFAVSNLVLSVFTLWLGPYFFGYGFAASLLLSNVLGITLLRRFLYELHYRTFMFV